MNRTLDHLTTALTGVDAVDAIRVIFEFTTDDELVAAWLRNIDQYPDPLTDLLIVELQRRGIAF